MRVVVRGARGVAVERGDRGGDGIVGGGKDAPKIMSSNGYRKE